ncbi:MAG: peptidoglycan-associated lipoprotein Pal [Deltaproteobacteria bacterium]|nr:peptidoglycan-associated lipoprotein Pal [Deltaproteobacteria bacterium]
MSEGQQGAAVTGAAGTGQGVVQGAASGIGEENLSSGARAATQGVSGKTAGSQAAATVAREAFLAKKLYFDFDDAALRYDAIGVLKDQARWLRSNPDVSIIIEGYCDERGTDEYNLALGARRAESVKSFLAKAGIDAGRMMTISYGEERPVDPGHNEDAWAKNRRVEFAVR